MSLNRLLTVYGLEEYLNTPLGDRIFKVIRRQGENGKQFLDWSAFLKMQATTAEGSNEEKAQLLIELFDREKDECLEREEMISAYLEIFKSMADRSPAVKKVSESLSPVEVN